VAEDRMRSRVFALPATRFVEVGILYYGYYITAVIWMGGLASLRRLGTRGNCAVIFDSDRIFVTRARLNDPEFS